MTEAAKSLPQKRKPRRFYRQATAAQSGDGWQVLLDGKSMKTPGKQMLFVPTEALAQAIAGEWQGQGEEIVLESMHLTQFSCASLDYTARFRDDVERETLAYAETDLLCYRAEEPEELVRRQNDAWNPVLGWSEKRYDIRMVLAGGIMPVSQPKETLDALRDVVASLPLFALTAVWLVAKHTSSLLVALAVYERHLTVEAAFDLSRVDETFQCEQWGEDAEAAEKRRYAATEMRAIGEFLSTL